METLAVLKNGVHFTTPELKALGVRFKEARREYEDKQAGLVEKAVETAATYLPLVESASALVRSNGVVVVVVWLVIVVVLVVVVVVIVAV